MQEKDWNAASTKSNEPHSSKAVDWTANVISVEYERADLYSIAAIMMRLARSYCSRYAHAKQFDVRSGCVKHSETFKLKPVVIRHFDQRMAIDV